MNIDNYLTCNFCSRKFDLILKKPRMIFKCGHSICNTCLENLFKMQKLFIICPKDHKKIILEDKTIESFPENFAILKILKSSNKNDDQDFDNNNEFEDLKNFKDDFEIEKKNNFKLENTENGLTKKFDIRNVQKNRSEQNLENLNMKFKKRYSMKDCEINNNFEICKIHNKILEIFCYNCNQFICYKCGLFGIHNVF